MEPFLGEIRAVAFPYAPKGWAVCNGALIPIRQSTALFALLGTTYGGDGQSTFGLPDLRGRAIVNAGQGQGLTNYRLGQQAGTETVTLTTDQMAAHTHSFSGKFTVSTSDADSNSPANNFLAVTSDPQYAGTASVSMAANSVTANGAPAGNNQPHPNVQPYLAVYYIISLTGLFPQRP